MNCLFCQKSLDDTSGKRHYCSVRCYKQRYAVLNKQHLTEEKALYHQEYRAEIIARVKKWRATNPDKVREHHRLHRVRYKDRPKSKVDLVKHKLRCRIHDILAGRLKPQSVSSSIGCSWSELVTYLESLFYNHPVSNTPMTWDNAGRAGAGQEEVWNIDHIQSLASFGERLFTPEGFSEACHYTNLQPLWHCDHVTKTQQDCLVLAAQNALLPQEVDTETV